MASNITKRDGNSSSAERGGVRPSNKNTNDVVDDDNAHFPPELWKGVMEYLPFDSILACGATCRTMLNAMPLLTKLCIDKSSQMNLAVASRFRDITEIHINSLLEVTVEEDGFTDMNLDNESKMRVVPFLTRFFKLERVVFGGKNSETGEDMGKDFSAADAYFYYENDESYPYMCARDNMFAFLDMISGAFICGALPKHLKIAGLCCPDATNRHGFRSNSCEMCLRACKSFPLQSVAEFECRGSSVGNALSGRMHCLDVCLERAQIDSIIESRPGGKQLLCSEDRLLRLLGRGRRYKIAPSAGEGDRKALFIVKYKQEELDEIKRVIAYAEIDVKKLSMQKVSNAIMRSFATNGNDMIPPKCQRYFSGASLEYLKDKLCLPIDKERFEKPLTDLMEHTQQFVWVLNQGEHGTNEEMTEADLYIHEDIEIDCLRLIRRFLEVEHNPPIQQITNAISYLAKRMGSTDDYKMEAASCLKGILERGNEEHRQMVIDAEAIPLFSGLLDSTNEHVAKVSLLALAGIATQGTNDDIKSIASVGAIPKLIGLLDSDHHDCFEASLQTLVVLEANGHIKQSVHASLLPHVIRLMKRKISVQSDVPSNCSILLRKILEVDQPPIQSVIELEAVPTLIEIMKTTEDGAIRTNLEHVMISLAHNDQSSTWRILVEKMGFLPVLVDLVNSQDDGIVEEAISTIGSVVNMSIEYRDLLLQTGIVKTLLRVLKEESAFKTLETASLTFAKCCRGKLDFVTSKESLKVLTELLVNEHEAVVGNSCLALFHILDGLDQVVLDRLACEGVNEVIDIGFIKPLLKLLPNAPHNVQEPALRSLHLITTAGDACIKAITLRNGMFRLSKALSSSHEANQQLACRAISNIISGNKERVQTAIDNNVVPCLAQMLTAGQNKKHALWAIYQMTKVGNAAQLKYLVTEDCVNHLCDLLIADTTTSATAILALKNILKVGKEHAPNTARLLSSGVQELENKLEQLTKENTELEHHIHRVDLLQKNKAWLEFELQNERVDLLKDAPESLNEQLRNIKQRLNSIEQKIVSASAGIESPLLQVYVKLREKENEAKAFLLSQISDITTKLGQATRHLALLREKAEEIVPQEEWKTRITRELSLDLNGTIRAIERYERQVTLIKNTRISRHRRKDIALLKDGVEKLFKNVKIEAKKNNDRKKKRKILGNPKESEDDTLESPKKKINIGTKVQASLQTFFGGKSKK